MILEVRPIKINALKREAELMQSDYLRANHSII